MIDEARRAEILRLAGAEHWPVGTIARHVGVHHDVVRRVLRQEGLPEVVAVRARRIDKFLPLIQETWAKYPKLAASRLYEMCKARGYVGHPDHFRHAVRPHRPRAAAEAFLRLRTLPGEQAQVDWAHFGHVGVGRARRPLVAFVMVLSFSRALFVRFMLSMRTEDFLRAHQDAFAHFQGIARVLLYDNLKSAVLERVGAAIRFNPLLLAFAGHHRYEPRPVAVARGNEKGRVERAIGYVRTGFFEGREWRDLDDLNAQALAWARGAARDRRWPEEPTRSVGQAYEQERGLLLPLPANPFPVHGRHEVSVGRTPYVRFDGNDYSVPHTLVRRTLVLLSTPEEVRILDGLVEVARHRRSYDSRGQVEDPAHVAALVEAKSRARRHRGLDRLAHAAPSSRRLLERLAERGQNLGHATWQMLRLLEAYGAQALEAALAEALAQDVPHVHAVRQVLEREHAARGRPPATALPLGQDPRVRDLVVRPHPLEDYDALGAPQPPAQREGGAPHEQADGR